METEVLQMQDAMRGNAKPLDSETDEELIDTLVAISVVSKRLATRLRKDKEKGGQEDGTHE